MDACYWVYPLVIFSLILAAALPCFLIPSQKLLWGDPQSYTTRTAPDIDVPGTPVLGCEMGAAEQR